MAIHTSVHLLQIFGVLVDLLFVFRLLYEYIADFNRMLAVTYPPTMLHVKLDCIVVIYIIAVCILVLVHSNVQVIAVHSVSICTESGALCCLR